MPADAGLVGGGDINKHPEMRFSGTFVVKYTDLMANTTIYQVNKSKEDALR